MIKNIASKKLIKPKITIELTRYKNDWRITHGDFSIGGQIEWKMEFDDLADENFEKDLSKLLKKYETPEVDIRGREELIRKMKLRFEGN